MCVCVWFCCLRAGSRVDLLSPRLQDDFPSVCGAQYQEALLRPGDLLFIPRHHWHYCAAVPSQAARALLTQARRAQAVGTEEQGDLAEHAHYYFEIDPRECFSWSVNFWWGERIIKKET